MTGQPLVVATIHPPQGPVYHIWLQGKVHPVTTGQNQVHRKARNWIHGTNELDGCHYPVRRRIRPLQTKIWSAINTTKTEFRLTDCCFSAQQKILVVIIVLILLCVGVCVSACHKYAGACRGQKMTLAPLEVTGDGKLPDVGTGNWTLALWMSSKHS